MTRLERLRQALLKRGYWGDGVTALRLADDVEWLLARVDEMREALEPLVKGRDEIADHRIPGYDSLLEEMILYLCPPLTKAELDAAAEAVRRLEE